MNNTQTMKLEMTQILNDITLPKILCDLRQHIKNIIKGKPVSDKYNYVSDPEKQAIFAYYTISQSNLGTMQFNTGL